MTAITSGHARFDLTSLSPLAWFGLVAAAISGVIHLLLGIRMAPTPMGISFLLAAGGFFGAIVLVLVDYHRRAVYAVGIPFTLLQILLWYGVNFVGTTKTFPSDVGVLGAIDKLAQVLVLGVLVMLLR